MTRLEGERSGHRAARTASPSVAEGGREQWSRRGPGAAVTRSSCLQTPRFKTDVCKVKGFQKGAVGAIGEIQFELLDLC